MNPNVHLPNYPSRHITKALYISSPTNLDPPGLWAYMYKWRGVCSVRYDGNGLVEAPSLCKYARRNGDLFDLIWAKVLSLLMSLMCWLMVLLLVLLWCPCMEWLQKCVCVFYVLFDVCTCDVFACFDSCIVFVVVESSL